jgi:hypothetical protein
MNEGLDLSPAGLVRLNVLRHGGALAGEREMNLSPVSYQPGDFPAVDAVTTLKVAGALANLLSLFTDAKRSQKLFADLKAAAEEASGDITKAAKDRADFDAYKARTESQLEEKYQTLSARMESEEAAHIKKLAAERKDMDADKANIAKLKAEAEADRAAAKKAKDEQERRLRAMSGQAA